MIDNIGGEDTAATARIPSYHRNSFRAEEEIPKVNRKSRKHGEGSGQDLLNHSGRLLSGELLVQAVVVVNELGEIET